MTDVIKLDFKDRMILANQCKILERLYPEEQEQYAIARKILEEGFEGEYDDCFRNVFSATVEKSVSDEVHDILQMCSDLEHDYNRLDDKFDLGYARLRFAGFDGNKDFRHIAYVNFLIDQGKYKWLNLEKGMNSHNCGTLEMYQRMLPVWRSLRKPILTKADIEAVLAEQVHPTRRQEVTTH